MIMSPSFNLLLANNPIPAPSMKLSYLSPMAEELHWCMVNINVVLNLFLCTSTEKEGRFHTLLVLFYQFWRQHYC